jgi:hypothetical protein
MKTRPLLKICAWVLLGFTAIAGSIGVYMYSKFNALARNPDRTPYGTRSEPPAYFAEYLDQGMWVPVEAGAPEASHPEQDMLDALGWGRNLPSLVRVYSTDTRRPSFYRWYKEDLVTLGMIQELLFQNQSERMMVVSDDFSHALIHLHANVVLFYTETEQGVSSRLLKRGEIKSESYEVQK